MGVPYRVAAVWHRAYRRFTALRASLRVVPELRRRGLLFVGLDVIGDYLTEINVTSPTCMRELDTQFGLNISAQLFAVIEQRHAAATGA